MKLKNGTVFPNGLFGLNSSRAVTAFNKTYQNHAIRAGIVVHRYEMEDKDNRSKLAVEYDVMVVEQDSNLGITPILYRNCLSIDGLGSIADFVEKKFRTQKKYNKKNRGMDFSGQDGAIVLLMCLDGAGEKAIIVGGLKHPDRKSKLVGKDELLAAEYNGVNFTINENGSVLVTFSGATDNSGKPKDSSQGNTTVAIEKDGSLELKNKGVTQRNQKDGKFILTAQNDVSVSSKKSISLTAEEKFSLKSKSSSSVECSEFALKASGSSNFQVQSLDLQSAGEANLRAQMINLEAQSMANIKASSIVLDGQVSLGSSGGTPAITLQTQFMGIGNLGAPVISTAIGPFSTKVTIT